MDVQGHMVQDMFDAGNLAEITDYCRCDVLDTYFIFLRSAVMLGQLKLEGEQQIVAETREWLEGHATTIPIYRRYLDSWGQWTNPWAEQKATPAAVAPPVAETQAAAELNEPAGEVAQ